MGTTEQTATYIVTCSAGRNAGRTWTYTSARQARAQRDRLDAAHGACCASYRVILS